MHRIQCVVLSHSPLSFQPSDDQIALRDGAGRLAREVFKDKAAHRDRTAEVSRGNILLLGEHTGKVCRVVPGMGKGERTGCPRPACSGDANECPVIRWDTVLHALQHSALKRPHSDTDILSA